MPSFRQLDSASQGPKAASNFLSVAWRSPGTATIGLPHLTRTRLKGSGILFLSQAQDITSAMDVSTRNGMIGAPDRSATTSRLRSRT